MKENKFNIIISGVGGQGLISLAKIIAQAAFESGFDVKTSELHGLSQRGGSVKTEIRFGKKIYSPLVSQGKADLIISLEEQEALAGIYYANKQTNFLINQLQTPTLGKSVSEKEILTALKKFSKNIYLVPAKKICQKEIGSGQTAGVFLLGLAMAKKILPLPEKSVIKAIKKVLPEKYWQMNQKALLLGKKFN